MLVAQPTTQRSQAPALLQRRGMARMAEFYAAGIAAPTVSRLERAGDIVRITQGLCQLPDVPLDTQQSLAEVSRLVPKGGDLSGLGLHLLTDPMPPEAWIAIRRKDCRTRLSNPPVQIGRFPEKLLVRVVESQHIVGTVAPVFGVGKTVADMFRYRRTVGDALAIEGLRKALRPSSSLTSTSRPFLGVRLTGVLQNTRPLIWIDSREGVKSLRP